MTSNAALESSAYRKASLRILPLIALGYGAAYIDRVNISFASLQMNRDLKFSATVYGFGAGVFFLSYAACEVPSNLLLYRFGARRWLARIMVTWGIVAMAMVFVRTPAEFYVGRFALGMAEAGFFPGVIFYVAQWFPPELRGRSISRFYVAWPLSVVVMGMLAGALMGLDGHLGLTGWQWLFAVEGFPPIVLGFVFFFLLPDGPATARWLTEPERRAVVARIDGRAAAGIALMNMIGILGGFVGPYWMGVAKDLTGDYRRGLTTMAIPMLVGVAIMVYLRQQSRQTASRITQPAAINA